MYRVAGIFELIECFLLIINRISILLTPQILVKIPINLRLFTLSLAASSQKTSNKELRTVGLSSYRSLESKPSKLEARAILLLWFGGQTRELLAETGVGFVRLKERVLKSLPNGRI